MRNAFDFDTTNWSEWDSSLFTTLSSNMDDVLLELDTLIQSLSTDPNIKPYDMLKLQLFGENYNPPTLQDLPALTINDTIHVLPVLNKHVRDINNEVLEVLNKHEILNIADLDYIGFTRVINGKKILNVEKLKTYVQLIDLICEADVIINDENYEEISLKLLYKCAEFCSM